jgi:DNA-binding NarL/FixJ family response regulator
MKNKEIAHFLDISENTVEKHMGTALARLREAISKHY